MNENATWHRHGSWALATFGDLIAIAHINDQGRDVVTGLAPSAGVIAEAMATICFTVIGMFGAASYSWIDCSP
jgi:hypothetical protein